MYVLKEILDGEILSLFTLLAKKCKMIEIDSHAIRLITQDVCGSMLEVNLVTCLMTTKLQ
jgi:hypothetical protein